MKLGAESLRLLEMKTEQNGKCVAIVGLEYDNSDDLVKDLIDLQNSAALAAKSKSQRKRSGLQKTKLPEFPTPTPQEKKKPNSDV